MDVFDDQAEQGLFLVEVEGVDDGQDAVGEALDSAAALVVAGEFLSLGGEAGASPGEVVAAPLEVLGSALQVGRLDQPGLVEIRQAATFVLEPAELAIEAVEFGVEEFVVGGGGADSEGLFAGEEHLGA